MAAALFMLLSSCSKSEYRKSLTEADSIASVNPQRAMVMLDSMKQEMAGAPEHEQMYYKLLCIKAPDKAYIKHTSDSMILKLVEYYETEGDKKLLPEAYYYAGRTYLYLYDTPQALEYYQKALDVTPESNMKFKGTLYFQIGRLFLNQAFYNKALDMYKKALVCDIKLNDSINIIHTLRDLAYTYNKNNQKDSSLYYYQKAYEVAKSMDNKQMKMSVLAQMAAFYINIGDYNKAKECLQPELSANIKLELSPDYTMALKICMNTSQYDSAHYYAQELLKVGTVYAKQTASRCLTELALMEKDYKNVGRYLKLFNEYTDSVKIITATESISRMNALYNYNLREKENLTLKAESANRLFYIAIVSSGAILVLIILIAYIYMNRQKRKEQTKRIKKLRRDLYEQSEEFIRQNKKKIDALEQELKITSEENYLLIERLEEQRKDLILANETARRKQKRSESAKTRIVTSDIYKTIQNHIKKENVINAKEWDKLEEIVNREIDNFKYNLYSYHNISQHEYHICVLIRLDFSPKEIGILLGCTTSGVSKARKRLQEKFFSDKGTAKDFDSFINSL